MKKNRKYKIVINNKLKAFGQTDTKTKLIEINKKKHKGDKKQLADTVKHEIFHAKHPKATEKTTYKKTDIHSKKEEMKFLAKLKNVKRKKLNYKKGALKRKFKMKSFEPVEPGSFIRKSQDLKRQVSIRGLV
jgi:hypothetical protein